MEKINERAGQLIPFLHEWFYEDGENVVAAFNSWSHDITDDISAMLVAIYEFYCELSQSEMGLFDFTHLLNKLAFQILWNAHEEVSDCEDCSN